MTLRWPSNFSLALIAGVILSAATPLGVHAQGVFDKIAGEVQGIFEKSHPAVVRVQAYTAGALYKGSGFFVDGHGTLVTSYAVVRESNRVEVRYNDEYMPAQVIGRDPRSGMAILKLDVHKNPFLKFGNSDKLKVASPLISVAFPRNFPASPSFGLMKGRDVRYFNRFFPTSHIRAEVKIRPGQIGGPMLNTKGQVVGMLVLSIQSGAECYALPSTAIEKVMGEIRKHGRARHGWVGIGVIEGPRNREGLRPVMVSRLYKNTPAATSGIRNDDVVLEVDGRSVHQPSDILDAGFFSTVGSEIPVKVLRNGEEKVFKFSVTERPNNAAFVQQVTVPGAKKPTPSE